MKNIWIVANWKSNKTLAEALEWVDTVGPQLERRENIKVVVCPTFVDLEEVKKAVLVGNYPMLVGSQDLSEEDIGAHTGEEAARLLKEFVDLSILGHSERRKMGETDEGVAKKVEMALKNNIIPLVCVQDENIPIPDGVSLVAYEPVFAIGTGHPDTPRDAQEVAKNLIRRLADKAKDLEVLYGGSATAENVKAFLQQDDINGVLVGIASLEAKEFLEIVKIAYFV